MTPQGHRQLQEELRTLLRVERPKVVNVVSWAAGNGDRSENGDYIYGKRRLREIDRRIRFLSKRLEIAQVVDPTQQKHLDQVFFGATVTYAHERGTERTITIVGIDEAGRKPSRRRDEEDRLALSFGADPPGARRRPRHYVTISPLTEGAGRLVERIPCADRGADPTLRPSWISGQEKLFDTGGQIALFKCF
jgi:transcription elongation factor GreB